MSENSTKKDLQFVFPLTDYYVAEKRGFKAHELLTKYDGDNANDLILIDDNLEPHSLFDYITSALKNKLEISHIKSTNQHLVATELASGFMSATDKMNLNSLQLVVNYIKEIINNTMTTDIFYLKDLSYEILDDKLKINGQIKCGNFILDIPSTLLKLTDRPDKDFTNAYGKVSYRDDLVYAKLIENENNIPELELVLSSDIKYNEDIIVISNKEYIYNKTNFIYESETEKIIPLYKLRRYNSTYVSPDNIMGRRGDLILSSDEIFNVGIFNKNDEDINYTLTKNISRLKQGLTYNNNKVRILRSNLSRDVKSALLYIPFNNSDEDKINSFTLNKNCSYQKSPYGNMMRNSSDKGNYVQLSKKVSNFMLEFLLDTESIVDKSETIISLKNITIADIVTIVNENGVLKTIINNTKYVIPIDFNKKFNFINLQYNLSSGKLVVYINSEKTNEYNIATIDDPIRYIQVEAMDTSLGEVLISTQMDNICNDINTNVYLVNGFNDIKSYIDMEYITTKMSVTDTLNDYYKATFSLATTTKISKNDILSFNFNNNIVDIYNSSLTISDIYSNKILVKNNNFKIDDIVIIYNGVKNMENYYHVINTDGDYIYLDKIIDTTLIGYHIDNIFNGTKLLVKIGDEILDKIYTDKNSINVMFDKEYDIDSEIEVTFIKSDFINSIFDKVNTFEIVSINDIYLEKSESNELINLNKDDITVKYNDKLISNEKLQSERLGIVNDKINISCDVNMNDFIIINNVNNLNKAVEISCDIRLSSGSNEVIINDKSYDRGNLLTDYHIDNLKIDDNGHITFNINTKSNNSIGKIIIEKINIIVRFKDGELFKILNQDNKVTDYVLLSDKYIYTDSTSPINIIITEKTDNYKTIENYTEITNEIDGYSIVIDDNNILKIKNKNKFYDLDKRYIYER